MLSTGPGTEVVFSQQFLTGWMFVGNREGIPLWESARSLFVVNNWQKKEIVKMEKGRFLVLKMEEY